MKRGRVPEPRYKPAASTINKDEEDFAFKRRKLSNKKRAKWGGKRSKLGKAFVEAYEQYGNNPSKINENPTIKAAGITDDQIISKIKNHETHEKNRKQQHDRGTIALKSALEYSLRFV
jgi:hypothetical protein